MCCVRLLACALLTTLPAMAQEIKVPKTPVGIEELLFAQPFVLEQGYQHTWGKDPVMIHRGTLVVLKVDPALVVPRNAAEPILYAGSNTVQRLNHGHESGHVIGIIPGVVDLKSTPIWFGHPGLPDHVTEESIKKELELARKAEIQPFPAEKIEAVTKQTLRAPNLAKFLSEQVAELVLKFSPAEKELVQKWQLPVVSPVKQNPR